MVRRNDVVPGMALLIDHDGQSRRTVRRVLQRRGLDLVQAGTGLVGLELIQRLSDGFRFVLVELDLPGLPGRLVVETLALCRPDLPVLCLGEARAAGVATSVSGCVTKPLQEDDLEDRMRSMLSGAGPQWRLSSPAAPDVVARAHAKYRATGDLVEAALELSRGMSEEDF